MVAEMIVTTITSNDLLSIIIHALLMSVSWKIRAKVESEVRGDVVMIMHDAKRDR